MDPEWITCNGCSSSFNWVNFIEHSRRHGGLVYYYQEAPKLKDQTCPTCRDKGRMIFSENGRPTKIVKHVTVTDITEVTKLKKEVEDMQTFVARYGDDLRRKIMKDITEMLGTWLEDVKEAKDGFGELFN